MSKKDASLAPVPPSAMTILLSPVAGVVMFVFLLAGLLSCLWAMFVSGKVDLLPKEHGWAAISEGEITHQIAKELSHVTLARKAADLERAASWLLIGDTGARVRQGCPGWLFLADENRIQAEWVAIVGRDLARHAAPGSLTKGVLAVYVSGSAWLAELKRAGARNLVAKINAHCGEDTVRDIAFRAAPSGYRP